MKTINLNSKLPSSEKEILRKASEEYDRGDITNALNHFLSAYQQGIEIEGLQLSIALCLIKQNKRRQARLFAFRELLDYPNNKYALKILAEENSRVNGRLILRSFTQSERPDHFPDISLVLIVKNEEKDLARCLESFRDIVKEIIVVDTGSTDRTVEIAKSFGARVEYFEWCNDFSAARNESLKYATCEWILRTDADEYIEEDEKSKLLHCVNSGLADLYLCPTISNTPAGEISVENVRLIKNHLGVEYSYPIHETVTPSANRLGLIQCLTNIRFLHTGYESEENGFKSNKVLRNLNVCEKYLINHPEDFYVRIIKALFKNNLLQTAEAIAEIEETLKKIPEDTLAVRYLGIAEMLLAKKYIDEKNDIGLATVLLDMQIDFNTFSTMLQHIGEIYLYYRGDVTKAKKIFFWTANNYVDNKTYEDILPNKKYNQKQCYFLLADSYVLLKEYEKSRKTYLKASTCKNEFENEENDQNINKTEDELRILAKSYKEKSEWFMAYKCILQAASKNSLCYQDYIELATCQINLNHPKLAQVFIDEMRIMQPDSSMVANLEAFIYSKDQDYEKALEKGVEAFIRDPGVSGYQNNIQQIAKKLGLTPIDAIRKIGLSWIDSGRRKDGLFALIIYLKFKPEDNEIKRIIAKYSN